MGKHKMEEKLLPLIKEGVSFFDDCKFEEAADNFKKILELDPLLAHVRTNLGVCYVKLEKYDLAEKEFKKVLEKLPDDFNARYHLTLALYYSNTDREGEALEECKKALEIEPNSHLAINTMGVISGFNGEIEEEINYYKKALEIAPDFVDAYMNLAYAYQKNFNDEEAIKSFKKVIELAPGSEYSKEAEDMLKDLGGEGEGE